MSRRTLFSTSLVVAALALLAPSAEAAPDHGGGKGAKLSVHTPHFGFQIGYRKGHGHHHGKYYRHSHGHRGPRFGVVYRPRPKPRYYPGPRVYRVRCDYHGCWHSYDRRSYRPQPYTVCSRCRIVHPCWEYRCYERRRASCYDD